MEVLLFKSDGMEVKRKGWFTPISFQRQVVKSETFSVEVSYFRMKFRICKERSGTVTNVKIVFVSGVNTTNIQQFYLMSKCSHMVGCLFDQKHLEDCHRSPNITFVDHYDESHKKSFKKSNFWYLKSWILINAL